MASVSLAGAAFFSAAGSLLLTVRPSSLGDPHHSLKAVLFPEADGTHPGRTLVDVKSCSRRLGVDLEIVEKSQQEGPETLRTLALVSSETTFSALGGPSRSI